jgi:uncharacterized protein
MKIVLFGGTGLCGTLLARHFRASGENVLIVARRGKADVLWDGRTLNLWTHAVDGADVWINLAGRSVNCRYHVGNRREILESRVETTRLIGRAWRQVQHPPRLWMNMSTATIYRHALDHAMDERNGELGGNESGTPSTWNFSIDVAKRWEEAFFAQETPGTHKLALRSAMVMSPRQGSAFDVFSQLVRYGLGGVQGSGRQFVSWIHEQDFVRSVAYLIGNRGCDPIVNLASPQPVPNRDFMREIRRAWGVRIGLPTTKCMLELGAFFLRTETELILKSRQVVSRKLFDAGFQFDFPSWPVAAQDLVRRAKVMRGNPSGKGEQAGGYS